MNTHKAKKTFSVQIGASRGQKRESHSTIIPDVSDSTILPEPSGHPISKMSKRVDIEIRAIDISEITPDPSQPRKHFPEESLRELANSIIEKGVLQPIALKYVDPGFQIIYGERRWRACALAGLNTIPAIVHDAVKDIAAIRFIENIHREDLMPEDLASSVNAAFLSTGCTQEEYAKIIGKNQTFVAKCLRIASFLSSDGVSDAIEVMRKAGDFDIGFERFYDAATQSTPKEGVEFLKNVVLNKMTTTAVRKMKNDSPTVWTDKNFVRLLTRLRAKLDFSFFNTLNIDNQKNSVLSEIEKTIVSFNEAVKSLKELKETIK